MLPIPENSSIYCESNRNPKGLQYDLKQVYIIIHALMTPKMNTSNMLKKPVYFVTILTKRT